MSGSEGTRPRITKELVYRNVSRSANKTIDKLAEDENAKRIAAAIEELRKEIKAGDLERDKLKAAFNIERQDLTLQLETLVKEKTDAKERAVYHMNQYEDAASKLQLIKDEHASIANKLRDTVNDLRNENNELTNQLTQTQRQYEATRDELAAVEDRMQHEMQRLQAELECMRQLNEQHEHSTQEFQQHIERLLTEDKQMNDTQSDTGFLDDLDDQCQQQARVIKQLEAEKLDLSNTLDQYKQRYPDLTKMDEERHRVDRELKEAERIRQHNVELKIENNRLKAQASEWTQYLDSEQIDKYSSPQEIVYKLSTGRAAMREAELRARQLEQELEETKAGEAAQTQRVEELQVKVAELEQTRKRDLLEKECLSKDKKMLEIHRDLLEHQLTVISKVEEANATDSENSVFPLTERLAELESLLKDQQQELLTTRAELTEVKSSPSSGRILELKSNPASAEQHVRREQLESLRLENHLLLRELAEKATDQQQQQLDENTQGASGQQRHVTVPLCTISNLQSEIDTLSSRVASKDKRILRLQQVFSKKLDEMDHVIQSLLGYSLEFRSDGTVRVCSTFVHESDLAFVFKSNPNDEGTIGIIGRYREEYMHRLQGTYDTFVLDQNNIPAFLSSVTLELLNSVGEEENQGYGYESDEMDECDNRYDEGIQEDHDGAAGNESEPITIDDDDD